MRAVASPSGVGSWAKRKRSEGKPEKPDQKPYQYLEFEIYLSLSKTKGVIQTCRSLEGSGLKVREYVQGHRGQGDMRRMHVHAEQDANRILLGWVYAADCG